MSGLGVVSREGGFGKAGGCVESKMSDGERMIERDGGSGACPIHF